MYKLELTEKELKNLHEYGNDSTQGFLEKNFPEFFKSKINSLQKALDYLGKEDIEVINLGLLQGIHGLEKYVAEQSLVVWFRAINDKHDFDWSEDKHFGWWECADDGIRFHDVHCCFSRASASLRLCTKTKEQYLELKDNKEFCSLMKTYLAN